MVPAGYTTLASLPLTPAGKVDLAALPKPPAERSSSSGEAVKPRTDTERLVARVWREVLEIEDLGVTDDFFALGGHSLLATQVVVRLRRELGIELAVRAVFEAPTVAGLAGVVEQAPPDSSPALVRNEPTG